ncbi:MAG: hypothetical protein ACT4N4_08665 [Rhodospirillales bacterium]
MSAASPPQQAAAIAASALALLAPAIWNGFPLMFFDTGAFIEQALTGGFVPERSVFYSWFLALFLPKLSLWPAVAAQALMTVWIMAELARALAPELAPERAPGRFLALALALAAGTALPWFAGQVLADILAPLMVLSLYLLGFHANGLDWKRRLGLTAVAVLGATSHASHLGLAGGLAIVTAAAQWIARPRPAAAVRPSWAMPSLVFALSLALIVASNFARTGEVFFSRAGSAFVFARLLQDGIVKRLLDDTCPQSGYALCEHKDNLPRTANDWLWSTATPFWEMGAFEGTEAESRRIIADSLKRYPLMHLETAVKAAALQFALFSTGDGIEPQNHLLVPIFQKFLPRQLDAYNAARQQNRQISFAWINPLHVGVGALSMLALAAFLAVELGRPRGDWDDRAFLPAFLLLALLGNALICGVASNPHDRYQSRLIWPVFFVVLLLGRRDLSGSIPRTA